MEISETTNKLILSSMLRIIKSQNKANDLQLMNFEIFPLGSNFSQSKI